MINEQAQCCPCGSNQSFESCCGKFINYSQYPDTPEQLMRSRYSAYALKNETYLLNSWHEFTRPDSLELKNDTTQWRKLKIIFSSENAVHFVAFFSDAIKNKERIFSLYEKSEFIKDKHWLYLEGKDLKTIELSKNMRCPCQSGKKFKRCCATEI